MGFFSELKSDLSQAVNTLMPEDKLDETAGLDNENGAEESVKKGADREKVDIGSMLDRIDDIKLDEAVEKEEVKEEISEPVLEEEAVIEPVQEEATEELSVSEEVEALEEKIEELMRQHKEEKEFLIEQVRLRDEIISKRDEQIDALIREIKVANSNTSRIIDLAIAKETKKQETV